VPKDTNDVTVFFARSRSAHSKAAHGTLMKLSQSGGDVYAKLHIRESKKRT